MVRVWTTKSKGSLVFQYQGFWKRHLVLGFTDNPKVIQEHGGKISVESSEGAGSIFRLEFPLDRLPQGTYGEHEE